MAKKTVKVYVKHSPFRLAVFDAACLVINCVVPYWWHEPVCKALAQWVVRGAKFEVE